MRPIFRRHVVVCRRPRRDDFDLPTPDEGRVNFGIRVVPERGLQITSLQPGDQLLARLFGDFGFRTTLSITSSKEGQSTTKQSPDGRLAAGTSRLRREPRRTGSPTPAPAKERGGHALTRWEAGGT
jgi:hypothetical protein